MGFLDFGNDKPRVTHDEYRQKVKAYLSEKGFRSRDLEKLDGYFHGNLHESGTQKGIDAHEIDQTVGWLREHKHDHHFSDEQIDTIDHAFKKHL